MYVIRFEVLRAVVMTSFIIMPPTYLWLKSSASKKTA
jgi:hypothetical protein